MGLLISETFDVHEALQNFNIFMYSNKKLLLLYNLTFKGRVNYSYLFSFGKKHVYHNNQQ